MISDKISEALNDADVMLGRMGEGLGLLYLVMNELPDNHPRYGQLYYLIDAQERLRVEAEAAVKKVWNCAREAGL